MFNYTGQQFFASPLVYPAPQPRDGGNADAAVWLQAIGLVHPPLSIGEHLLSLNAVYGCFDFGYVNTWHITVQPKGKG